MRRLIFQVMLSLDGYYEGQNGDLSWHQVDEEFNEYSLDVLNNVDLLVFGRKTYELMADYWPTAKGKAHSLLVANKMNELPKIVCSSKMTTTNWGNTSIINDNIIEEIRRLKNEPGEGIIVFGSAQLARQLAKNNLVDEYRFIINPVMLTSGKTLFTEAQPPIHLHLTQTIKFRSGKILLCYKGVSEKNGNKVTNEKLAVTYS